MIGYGIDFGTTNSVVATYNRDIKKVQPLLSPQKTPHPSVIWYKADGLIKVGYDAKSHIMGFSNVEGNQFITSIKRKLGKTDSISIFGQMKPVYEVASEIFIHLRDHATDEGHEINEAIVTVPVYFDGMQRRELRKAADEAGIFIKTFIHEPFAAIMGYIHHEGKDIDVTTINNQLILVFDWGGGTLDITLVQIKDRILMELATAGLNDVAGDFFDEKISKFARSGFIEKHGIQPEEINPSSNNIDRLLTECERAKKKLSDEYNESIQVAAFCQYNNIFYDIEQPISRKEFESLIGKDLRDAMSQVRKALDAADVHMREVDIVLMIGGSSRIPYVREEIRKMFGHRIIELQNADTIIAEGAAIIDGLDLQPVLAKDLCIELSDETLYDIFQKGVFAKPDICKKKVHFYCTDNRDGLAKLVLKERTGRVHEARTNIKEVLSIAVSPDLPSPYNHERVVVDFYLDRDLVLHVAGKGATQENAASCEIFDLCFGLSLSGEKI